MIIIIITKIIIFGIIKTMIIIGIILTIKVIAKLNTPLQITISDWIFTITKKGEIIESALKEETNITSIKQQLQKLGNTPYTLKEIEVIKDNNIFIRLSNLNEIRRYLTEKLTEMSAEFSENKNGFCSLGLAVCV